MSRRLKLVVVVLMVGLVVVASWIWSWSYGRYEFERLVDGSENVVVVTLVFEGQRKRLVVSDPESVRRFADLLRASSYQGYMPSHAGPTTSFGLTVTFGSRSHVVLGLEMSEHEELLTIMYGIDNIIADPVYYGLDIKHPLPDELATTLRELRK